MMLKRFALPNPFSCLAFLVLACDPSLEGDYPVEAVEVAVANPDSARLMAADELGLDPDEVEETEYPSQVFESSDLPESSLFCYSYTEFGAAIPGGYCGQCAPKGVPVIQTYRKCANCWGNIFYNTWDKYDAGCTPCQ
jgi:hypothetical protein